MKPSVKSFTIHPCYFIKKVLLKSISAVITMAICMYMCLSAPLFQVSVSWSSEMPYSVTPWKHGVAHNPMLHSRFLCVCVCVCACMHARACVCPFQRPVFVSNLFSSSCPWSEFEACSPCFVLDLSPTLVLNSQCDNFEDWVVRMITFLKMINFGRWKNIFFAHFECHLLMT